MLNKVDIIIKIDWEAHDIGPHGRYNGTPLASGLKLFKIEGESLDTVKASLQEIINHISEKTNGANATKEGLGESQVPGVSANGPSQNGVFAMRGTPRKRSGG